MRDTGKEVQLMVKNQRFSQNISYSPQKLLNNTMLMVFSYFYNHIMVGTLSPIGFVFLLLQFIVLWMNEKR